MKKKNIPYR